MIVIQDIRKAYEQKDVKLMMKAIRSDSITKDPFIGDLL